MRWILRRDPGKNLDIEDEDAMSFLGGRRGRRRSEPGAGQNVMCPQLRRFRAFDCVGVKEHDWRPRRSRRLTP